MHTKLYDDGTHKCVVFYNLVPEENVLANQFLVIDGNHAAIIDPGGNLIFKRLKVSVDRQLFGKTLDYVIGSHQDPDIISSMERWLVETDCKVLVPAISSRFITHVLPVDKFRSRIIGIHEKGMDIKIGNAILKAIPAHFLHSEGNFQFYDPVSKILFSGDMGASPFLQYSEKTEQPVEDFSAHIRNIEGFHRRYMSGNKVCRYWVNMVRGLDIEWLVPQHGRPFKGKAMIERFFTWIEELECGIDLVTQENYKIP
jgi:flavorubredoxin